MILRQPFLTLLMILRQPFLTLLLVFHLPRSAFLLKLCPKFLAQFLDCRQQVEKRSNKHRQKSNSDPGKRSYDSPDFCTHH